MNSSDNLPPVYQTLASTATAHANSLAIIDRYGEMNYGELWQASEELAQQLRRAGVRHGQGVATIFRNDRHFITGLYAIIGCGAVAMPLFDQLTPAEIERAIAEANIHFVLTDMPEMSVFGTIDSDIAVHGHPYYLAATTRDSDLPVVDWVKDAAVMRFTSGTTGDARCVILSHKAVMERTAAACEGLPITTSDRIVWVLPMAYHFVVSLMLYVRYGASIIVCEDFLADAILGDIQKHSGTLLYASPMHIRLLANHQGPVSIPTLQRVISTTTGISASVCLAFHEKFHIPVWQAFGIIEVGLPVINQQKAVERPDAVGHALPAYEVAILDDHHQRVPAGREGRLAFRGPGMFDGYLSPTLPRAAVLREGWFLTGDLAMMDDDGLITIKGREKSVINVSGNKVFPNEVEEVINTYEGIVQSRVYAHSHPLVGEIVAAEIVLQGALQFDEEALIRFCRMKLASFKIPQKITVVQQIVMTGSGKVKR